MPPLLKRYLPLILFLAGLLLCWGLLRSIQRAAVANAEAKATAIKLKQAELESRALGDSLRAAHDQVAVAIVRVDTLWRTRTVAVATADVFGHLADSARTLVSDSGEICPLTEAAYRARTSECAALRVAVGQDSVAITLGQDALRAVREQLTAARATTTSIEAQLREARKPYVCKVLFVAACPSRTASAVLGALAGAALMLRVAH